MRPVIFAMIAALALLVGCSSSPTQPDWVSGDSTQYKTSLYLLGRGEAASQEEARDRARADLAKIFQVEVNVSSEDIQKFKSSGTAPGQYESETSRRIATHTDQIIQGIQIAQLWQDPATHNYHALAVLPRMQTAASLRQQIGQLDDATDNFVAQSRASSDIFLKIASASQALEAQLERNALQKSLQVVDITGRGLEPRWNSSRLQADLDVLLKRVSIISRVPDGSSAGLADIVAGALAHAGYMADTGQHPDFVLLAQMHLQDLGMQEGWYWLRGTLEISLSEAGNGRVRGTRRWDIKVSASDRETAGKRALDQADKILRRELGSAIIAMATGNNQ